MSKSFLIVDDSRVSRMFIRQFVTKLMPDWHVAEAGNSDEALSLIELQSYDIVSVDFNMPGINGLDLSKMLQEKMPYSFIALVTANIQKSTEQATQQLKINYYKKPVSEEMIQRLIVDAENHNA